MPPFNDLHDHEKRPRHARTFSEPLPTTERTRSRKISLPHPLLRISTASRAASSVVDLTRILSPSLASFTPSEAPAYVSLRGLPFASTQARPRKQRPSLFSIITSPTTSNVTVNDNANVNDTKPTHRPFSPAYTSPLRTSSPSRSCSPTPPPSPTMSIPSISRTHSTAASGSLPATPPLPLSPLSLLDNPPRRRHHTIATPPTSKVFIYSKRERTPSLPVPVSPDQLKSEYPRAGSPLPSPSRPQGHGPNSRRYPPSPRERTASLPLQPSSSSFSRPSSRSSPRSLSPFRSLHTLESHSKLMQFTSICAVCGIPGPDFPRCPRCGDAWCSRRCRAAAAEAAAGRGAAAGGPRGHGCRAVAGNPKPPGKDGAAPPGHGRNGNSRRNSKSELGHMRVVVIGR